MSAGFIPMVSTTPPPMSDDDDFADFAEHSHDDFGEFSSALDEDSFCSYPTPEIHFGNEDFQTNEFASRKEDDGEGEFQDFCDNKHNESDIFKASPPISLRSNGNGEVENEALDFNSNQNSIDANTSYKIESQENVASDTAFKDLSNFHVKSADENQEVVDAADCDLADSMESCDAPNESLEQAATLSIVSNLDNEQTQNDNKANSFSEICFSTEDPSDRNCKVLSEIVNENELPSQNQIIADSSFLDKDSSKEICFSDDESNDGEPFELSQELAEVSSPEGAIQFSSMNNDTNDEIVDEDLSESLSDNLSEKESLEEEKPGKNSPSALNPVAEPNPDEEFSSANYLPNDFNQNTTDKAEPANAYFECDFGAFDNNRTDSGTNDFANFSSVPAHTTTEETSEFTDFASNQEEEDDDFGDFDSNPTWATVTVSSVPPLSCQEKMLNYVVEFYKTNEDLPSKDDDDEDDSVSLLDERLKTDVLTKESETQSNLSEESIGVQWPGELWDQLEDIDNTNALSFVWNGSNHNKQLLDALGMYTQNILFSGTKQVYYVPTYYAAGLGLIDPSKGTLKPMSAAEKITAISPAEKTIPLQQDDQNAMAEHFTEWKSVADKKRNSAIDKACSLESSRTVGNSVFADGAGSDFGGLGIGKDTHTVVEARYDPVLVDGSSLDLDFFDHMPTVLRNDNSPSKSDLIDPELLELTTAPTTEPPPPTKDGGTAAISRILASLKGGNNQTSVSTTVARNEAKWEEEESKLSNEARSVLHKLPDLSYMRSKVLVFPINMSRVTIGDEES